MIKFWVNIFLYRFLLNMRMRLGFFFFEDFYGFRKWGIDVDFLEVVGYYFLYLDFDYVVIFFLVIIRVVYDINFC